MSLKGKECGPDVWPSYASG